MKNKHVPQVQFADKQELKAIMEEQNALMEFVPDPTATPESIRAQMRALGIRAEDNIFSCGIIAARDED